MSRRLRVLLAKTGLDGHDRGLKIIARRLRDNGYEVIYLGRRQSIEAIVRVAVEEDVDAIGVSVLSGTHKTVAEEVLASLRAADVTAPVVLGGTILRRDVPDLLEQGIDAVFPVGTTLEEIDAYFEAVESTARA
ncbi:MAG TPA: cobalamin-dependent protein [Solirubrobacterales bacterium]|jgi:methylmalonyl-CoA mutase C-terminal domain/subunit|nr:cobalamin-dependent protein [Solirubrobacterales bacterium]